MKCKVTSIVHQAKSLYLRSKISACESSRQLFDVCGRLCGKKKKNSLLPTTHPVSALPQIFCDFFVNKIANIRRELDQPATTHLAQNVLPASTSCGSSFDSFHPVTTDEVRKVITQSKPTTCPLDPIPAPFLLEFLDDLLPVITQIMNQSLLTGIVPPSFKSAVVKPLLKKPSLD